MKKSFIKNLFRDIKKTLSRFLSIVIIISIGVSFYGGIRATSPDMKMSADNYFNENNLMDFKIISTLGITSNDLAEVEKQKGVKAVEGTYSLDAVIEKDKHSMVVNVNSLPKDKGINNLRIIRGRTPKNDNEAIVEENFFQNNKYKLNDTIILQSGNESKMEESLKNNQFKIVGTAESPLYISAQRQLSSVGNGSVKGFIYILPQVFKSEVYTEAYIRTDDKSTLNSLLDNNSYNKSMDNLEKNLKALGSTRSDVRYVEVIKEANDKISDGEQKLNNSKKEAADKFKDGYNKISEGRDKLKNANEELKNNEDYFYNKIAEGTKELEAGKDQIKSAENEINLKSKEIEKGKSEIADGKKQLDASEQQVILGKQQASDNISAAIQGNIIDLKKQLDNDPNNASLLQQYNFLNLIYENDIKGKDFDGMYSALKKDGFLDPLKSYFDIEALNNNFLKAEQQLSSGRQQLADNEKLIISGEAQLQAGEKQLEENNNKIAASELQLNNEKQKGLEKLNQGKDSLKAAEKELDNNTANLKSEEEKANTEFKKGEGEIQKSKDKLKDIKKPEWYVLGRSTNVGFETYRQDSDRIDNIGKVFPLIFFLVAALVSLTTMTRMVQENRIEIGTFKALGYSKESIIAHYLIYALSASLLGSLIGISYGFKLFPPLIMNAYSSLYTIPKSIAPFNGKMAFSASILAIAFTTVAAVAATLEELREEPASLMRPKPPKAGKKILLERLTFLWKKLSFTRKITARNIFRYKQRFLMTVIGIAACTGLMITGFGVKEGIVGASEKQFNEIYKYDMTSTLTKDLNAEEKNQLKNKVNLDSNIKSILFASSKVGTVNLKNSGKEDIHLIVPEDSIDFTKYIKLTMENKPLKLDDGAIITEKLAKLMNKKVGDTFEMTIDDKIIKGKVSAITEHYIQHYIYMSPSYYEKVSGEKLTYNSFYGMMNSTTDSSENNTAKTLKSYENINAVSFKNNVHVDINSSMDSVNLVVLILIVSAGVLAFVVIYNLTNIIINERNRELATIKLLGFYDNELAAYIYRENIILTLIGSLLGIVFGIVLNNLVVSAAETNVMMFLRRISPIYMLYSVMLTILFSVVVNLAMYNRFNKIDMIESLKSPE